MKTEEKKVIMRRHSIKLRIDGKLRKFKTPRKISNEGILQRTVDLDKEEDSKLIIDKLYLLTCEIFGNQFTPEQLKNQFNETEIFPVANDAINYCIKYMLRRSVIF